MALSKSENIQKVFNHVARTLSQDTGSIQTGAAIWASLIQVLMRCRVAIQSYNQAPKNDTYTKKESEQVVYRELGGFAASYGIVKVINSTLKTAMKKRAGYQEIAPGTMSLQKGLSTIKGILSGKIKTIEDPPNVLSGESHLVAINPKKQAELKGVLSQEWLNRTGKKLQNMRLLDKAMTPTQLPKETFKFLHTWGPIVVGTIPALLISGLLLEEVTLKKGSSKDGNRPTAHNKQPNPERISPLETSLQKELAYQTLQIAAQQGLTPDTPYKTSFTYGQGQSLKPITSPYASRVVKPSPFLSAGSSTRI